MRRLIVTMMLLAVGFALPVRGEAGSLDEVAAAVEMAAQQGGLSDPDLKAMALELIARARGTDSETEAALRRAIIDLLTAYANAGITEAAAVDLIRLAQP
ncbi:MAG: hypothetical protein HYV03_00435 [Deltaproteobacteria bacterium]|nr:hypothetical protein [Deltaproteobacteria bacterium]